MLINLKVKTLDAQTHEFSIDNEITVRDFKAKIEERTNISAEQQRIIFCGRVLPDEKQLKEYDVDGKVIHVAERPPPSQRATSTSPSTGTRPATNLVHERRARPRVAGMRNSPLFRALDGMVVGTMAFPVNSNSNGRQPTVNPFTASSSFCMNRITVARHMLQCADNIAAYLENPSRGLNNTSLDILANGRWTMESTVVEVGISGEVPQSQNIVEMVQGAVTAALRRTGNTNVTVLQMPTTNAGDNLATTARVLIQNITEDEENAGGTTATNNTNRSSTAGDNNGGADVGGEASERGSEEDTIEDNDVTNENVTVNVEVDVHVAEDNNVELNNSATSDFDPDGTSTPTIINTDNAGNADTNNANNANTGSRRRTGTNVLAEVIQQMRDVQTRLNPFIDQFYTMLANDSPLNENDTNARENCQRLYDRVSEAFHYLSHAQHAISDLMLDVSQPPPRYLACRPILVDQSGYVSSNNVFTQAFIPPSLRQHMTPQQQQAAGGARNNWRSTDSTAATANSSSSSDTNNSSAVEDPIDEPIIPPPPLIPLTNQPRVGQRTNENNDDQQAQAAFLQAVVDSAGIDTAFHVHIDAPTITTVDVSLDTNEQSPSETNNTTTTAGGGGGGSCGGAVTSSTTTTTTTPAAPRTNNNNHQARVTTATLPTTSTQTRSTARPQIGNIPITFNMPSGWSGGRTPTFYNINNNVSTFDRFLPCNSHHIREPETTTNNGSNATTPGSTSNNNNISLAIGRNTNLVGSTMVSNTGSGNQSGNNETVSLSRATRAASRLNFLPLRNLISSMTSGAPPPISTAAAPTMAVTAAAVSTSDASTTAAPTTTNSATVPVNTVNQGNSNDNNTSRTTIPDPKTVYTDLVNFFNDRVFEGKPINEETIPPAINRAIQWFGSTLIFLPQFEKPEYDSRVSLFNILRSTLPLVIDLIKNDEQALNLLQFEQKLHEICERFRQRLYSVLYVCIGRDNAQVYWGQLMRLLLVRLKRTFTDEPLRFLYNYLNPVVPTSRDEVDAEQFVVHRATPIQQQDSNNTTESFVSPPDLFQLQPMDTDVDMMDEEATTSSTSESDEPLRPVVAGSEPWHRGLPNEWLPIITRDIERQTENPPDQSPFSDVYISGMSAKRRKLIQSSKPPSDIGGMVADSVRKAIQTVGINQPPAAAHSSQSQSVDDISRAIANDTAVQSSCVEAVRTNVRERLKSDTNYKADNYPQTSKFIKK